jgi:hypothetical integral membrane protein (TIGR02206 family)
MQLFGSLHISLLIAILVIAVALPVLCRRGFVSMRGARLALGSALAANELTWWVFRYSREGIRAANLPLQLCDLTVWLAVLGCLTVVPAIVEFGYFAGIGGAGMALLTPNLWSRWPNYQAVYFFIAHGGIVVAVALLAFGGFAPFRPRAVWRAFGLLLAYAAIVGAFNAATGSNFMFLCHRPANPSLLDSMGPWPWYIVAAAATTLACFWLLWLPVRHVRNWPRIASATNQPSADGRTFHVQHHA